MTTTFSLFSSVSRLATDMLATATFATTPFTTTAFAKGPWAEGSAATGTFAEGALPSRARAQGRLARVAAFVLLAASGLGAGTVAPVEADDAGAEIAASISGLRNDEGVVRIALYAREDQWLSHEHTVATCTAHVHGDSASCSLGHHAPGTYAIALLHDEDADGDMDTDFFGFPQEGYGFSSGARPGLGAPSFGDASFAHGLDRTVAAIRARYGL
jgi:uncharacterized protein (DUF2141 family)